jgi:gamma-glutamylcyclotransferase (GGCT)/AIG2-like uncharacterized protein YtfP
MRFKDIDTSYYFAYGHNTSKTAMNLRCPNAKLIGLAVLDHYRLTFDHYANIEHDPESQVHGLLWQLTLSDLEALDHDEDYPAHYKHIEIPVVCNDQRYLAMTYQMEKGYDDQSSPTKKYIRILTKGYLEHGIPTEQIEQALVDKFHQKD